MADNPFARITLSCEEMIDEYLYSCGRVGITDADTIETGIAYIKRQYALAELDGEYDAGQRKEVHSPAPDTQGEAEG